MFIHIKRRYIPMQREYSDANHFPKKFFNCSVFCSLASRTIHTAQRTYTRKLGEVGSSRAGKLCSRALRCERGAGTGTRSRLTAYSRDGPSAWPDGALSFWSLKGTLNIALYGTLCTILLRTDRESASLTKKMLAEGKPRWRNGAFLAGRRHWCRGQARHDWPAVSTLTLATSARKHSHICGIPVASKLLPITYSTRI